MLASYIGLAGRGGARFLALSSVLLVGCSKLIGINDVPANGALSSNSTGGETAVEAGLDAGAGSAPICDPACGIHEICVASQGTTQCACKTDPDCADTGNLCSATRPKTFAKCSMDADNCFYATSTTTCSGSRGVCLKGACVACTPGETRCYGPTASDSVQTCDQNGTWAPDPVPCDAKTPFCSYAKGAVCGPPPSCQVSVGGTNNCGRSGESCCTSNVVEGGTFYRTYSNDSSTGEVDPQSLADPATISTFRMDKYLVTVGRFRQFVKAWNGGPNSVPWRAEPHTGNHTHLEHPDNRQGLVNSGPGGGYEPGWNSDDDANIAPTDDNLTMCGGSTPSTWTAQPGEQELLPMNCLNWYEAFAFCIWDRGFLPSEAELEYAAAGGAKQLAYPWGAMDPGTSTDYAIYNCNYPTAASINSPQCLLENVPPVGTATLGAGRWGQLDLAGTLWEYGLDWYVVPYAPGDCIDCAQTSLLGAGGASSSAGGGAASTSSSAGNSAGGGGDSAGTGGGAGSAIVTPPPRALRGGNFRSFLPKLAPSNRGSGDPKFRIAGWGVRCIRPP